jgi:hypothetical protein
MRRYPAVLLLVLAASSVAHAQVTYGAKAGATFATVDSESSDNQLRLGLAAGGFVLWPLGSRLAVQPEVLLNQKGSKFDSELVEASFRIDYLEVPVLLRYNLSGSPRPFFVFGGPSVAFKLHAESKADFGDQSIDDDISDQVEDVEWGLVVGGGKEFTRFFVEGRYTHGMKDIDALATDIKNRAFTGLVGIRF